MFINRGVSGASFIVKREDAVVRFVVGSCVDVTTFVQVKNLLRRARTLFDAMCVLCLYFPASEVLIAR